MRLRVVVMGALVIGVVAAMVGGASAAGWLPSVPTATGDYGGIPEVAVDAQGNAVAVWRRHISGLEWSAVAATRPVGGRWSAPVEISRTATSMTDRSLFYPRVAVDAEGDAVAIWAGRDDPPGNEPVSLSIWSASRPAGGTWSEPVRVSSIEGDFGHDVVVDRDGNATAVWTQNDNEEEPGFVVRAATRPAGGTWSAPVDISSPSGIDRAPAIAVNPDGDVTAVWPQVDPGTDPEVVQTASRPAGGNWSAAETLSSDTGNSTNPVVVVDPDGGATAAWSYSDESGSAVQTAQRSTNGTWSQPVELADHAAGHGLRLAVDPQGNTTAAWGYHDPSGDVLLSSTLPAGGSWSAPVQLLRADGTLGYLQLVVDPQGDATLSWQVDVGSSGFPGIDYYQLEAARRTEGTWGSPAPVSPPDTSGGSSALAVDPQGYVTALWMREPVFAVNTTVSSSVFDSVAPVLNGVAVPATGVVGQPVTMSVDLSDLWSSVTARWEFGDGRSREGSTVEHCFSSPGEHTVTISGTDLAMNTVRTTATITIEPDANSTDGSEPCVPVAHPGPTSPSSRSDSPSGSAEAPDTSSASPASESGGGGDPIVLPVVSGLTQSHSRWHAQSSKGKHRLPIGTNFRLQLNHAAQVQFSFSRVVIGRQVAGRCVASSPVNRNKPRCSKRRTSGTLSVVGQAGSNTYAFRGKIGHRTLKPGRYVLRVTALWDGKQSTAATIAFTIAR